MQTKKILLIAGEPSGDAHGAKLIRSLRNKNSNVEFSGMGGAEMKAAGMTQIIDSSDMAVVGFVEILKIIRKIFHAFKVIKQFIKVETPDLVILIDYPGFNLKIAKYAKKNGCKVLYYISPQLWAWRKGRVKIVQQYVDEMAVILPFEVDFYQQHHVKAHYVGHPLLQDLPKISNKITTRKAYGLSPEQTVIGLCPGSRRSELKYLLPVLIETAKALRTTYPNCVFVVPQAPNLPDQCYSAFDDDDVIMIRDDFYQAISLCDAVITASGTATLQIALTQTPMAIIYKSSWISITIARFLVDAPLIGLCNLIAGRKIVKEFIQHFTPKDLHDEVVKMLDEQSYRSHMINELRTVTNYLTDDQQSDLTKLTIELL